MSIDDQVLKRYLDGKDESGDREKILEWFLESSYEKDLREAYRHFWDHGLNDSQDAEDYEASAVLDRINHEIRLEESKSLKKSFMISESLKAISRIAAVLCLIILTYMLINGDHLIPATSEVAWSKIYAPLGTRTVFYLPDGSTGWLNSDSYLEFPTDFRGKTRKVNLIGEAFFEVKTDPQKPFIVSGPENEVIAHGTKFNVMAYPGEEEIRVTLVEGNVDVLCRSEGKSGHMIKLEPDQMCVYDLVTSTGRVEKVNAEKIVSWKEGKLVFRNENFEEVVKRINRWYNVNLVIQDEVLKSYKYMATFEDETLDEVLKLLKISAPIDYRDIGRKVHEDGTYGKREIILYYKP